MNVNPLKNTAQTSEPEAFRVFTPRAGDKTKVKTQNPTDTDGVIYVKGLATQNNSIPTSVRAQVYLYGSQPTNLSNIPTTAAHGAITTTGPASGTFEFTEVATAGCDATGTIDNILVVWTVWPGGSIGHDTVRFFGKRSDTTEQ